MWKGIPAEYADGETIFNQGDPAADMYVIVAGGVRLYREQHGEPRTLAVLGPSEVFGEMGILAPGPRSATAVAQGPTTLEVIDRPTFLAIVDDEIVRRMLERFSERLRRLDEVLDASALADPGPPVT